MTTKFTKQDALKEKDELMNGLSDVLTEAILSASDDMIHKGCSAIALEALLEVVKTAAKEQVAATKKNAREFN